MKVVIATNNEVKVEGAKRALLHYFEDVDIIGINIESEVSDQPINNEIYKGAKNRIFNLKKYCINKGIDADLYFSIESGISNQLGEWQVISIAIIEDNTGLSSFSTTAGFPIPEKYIDDIVKKGVPYVMKNIFGDNTKQKGIQLLTNTVLSRIDLIEGAFIMGLIKVIHKGKWE